MSSPIVVLLDAWPQPSSAPEAVLFASETKLFLRYFTSEDEMAIIQFPLVKTFQFGAPNDEALGGHPLSPFGLKFYSVHRIENSPWIAELERRNAVHPSHDKDRFLKDAVHYVFTFQDSTLECVVSEGKFWHPKIQVLSNVAATAEWSRLINEMVQ
jgi:hypothetical protein